MRYARLTNLPFLSDITHSSSGQFGCPTVGLEYYSIATFTLHLITTAQTPRSRSFSGAASTIIDAPRGVLIIGHPGRGLPVVRPGPCGLLSAALCSVGGGLPGPGARHGHPHSP